jgi:Zn-dependent protease/CBS domain-containing protein
MRNIRVGSITGIPIRLNVTLVVFLPLVAYLISRPQQLRLYAGLVDRLAPAGVDTAVVLSGTTPVVVGVVSAVGLFAGVLLHELGHAWTARQYGVGISSITLWIFGGMAHMEDLPEEWNVEFYVALAGPATSLLVAAVCYVALFAVSAQPVVVFVVGWLAVINVTLAVFNMVPAFPMDGGRVLRALLARRRPYAEATQTAASVGKGLSVLMAALAVLAFAPLLLLVAMFVYVAAGAESRTAVLRETLGGLTARELMSSDIRTVTPETTIAEFLDRVMRERTTAYPVMDRGTVTGMVTLAAAQTAPADGRDARTVADVMAGAPPSVAPDADAYEVLTAMSRAGSDRAFVVEEGRFLGQITNADLVAAVEVLQGLGSSDRLEAPDGYA